MKKFLYLLSALLLLMLLLGACGKADTPDGTESGSDSESAAAPAVPVTLAGGGDDYVIVFPEKATEALKSSMKHLTDAMKDVTGKKAEFHTDKTAVNAEISREILVGVTNRTASTEALERVSAPGYLVEFVGDKLVILGSDDSYIKLAIEALVADWTATDGVITVSSDLHLMLDDSANDMPLVNADREFLFRVIGAAGDDYSAQYAQNMASVMEKATGASVSYRFDSAVDEGEYEILIGPTNRALSKKAYESLGVFEYRILTEGTQIAIVSYTTDGYEKLISLVRDAVTIGAAGTYVGEPQMPRGLDCRESINSQYNDFKGMTAGTLKGIFNAGDSYVLYQEGTTAADAAAYIKSLTDSGYTKTQTYALGDNAYTLLTGNKYTVYVSHLPMVNATRIYVEQAGTGNYPTVTAKETVAAPLATPAIWQLEVDTYTTRANGGMSYVMQLSDGRFIVVDGGYSTRYGRTSRDAENLYQLLLANKPASHDKPIVAGWFITHLHTDHFGAMSVFSNTHASDVTVEAFYYNFPATAIEAQEDPISAGASKGVETAMKRFEGAVLYNKLHSGMSVGIGDAEIKVICTFEDVYPNTFADANDTCTVFRVELGNQKIMFLGDARESQSLVMETTIPASVLESGIVQFSHHGYEGCNAKLYQLVNAHTVLWPMNIVSFQPSYGATCNVFAKWYRNRTANQYIANAEHVKKIIVAGQGTVKLELPYTPTGDRIIDYNAYYTDNVQAYRDEYYNGQDPSYKEPY